MIWLGLTFHLGYFPRDKCVEVNYQSPNFPTERLPGYVGNSNIAATIEQAVLTGQFVPAVDGTVRDSDTAYEIQVCSCCQQEVPYLF